MLQFTIFSVCFWYGVSYSLRYTTIGLVVNSKQNEKSLLKRWNIFLKCLPVLPCHVCLQLMLALLIITWLESRPDCPFLHSLLSKTLTLCMTKFFWLLLCDWLSFSIECPVFVVIVFCMRIMKCHTNYMVVEIQ